MTNSQRIQLIANRLHEFVERLTFKKVVILGGLLITGILSSLFLLFLLTWTGVLGALPEKQELLDIQNPTASEVYSADSVLLGRYFLQERSTVLYADIPQHVIDAVIVTEDVRFYNHDGMDLRSLARVLIKSILLQQESSGGGSTLTQQLAKNLYPRKDYWFFSLIINKFREMIIASRLEKSYDKQAILLLYLNTVSFGGNTFGLEAAAQRFFAVHVHDLTIDQAALLIGMLKATYSYNPRINPEKSLERRNVVLSQLEKYGKLTADMRDSLQSLPIQLEYNRITHHTGLATYFREYLRSELLQWCKEYNETHEEEINLYTDGLKIYTTIDSRLQQHAEDAMTRQMTTIQKKFLNHWGKKDPWGQYPGMIEEVVRNSNHYKKLEQQGLSDTEIMAEMKKPALMNIFYWEGEKEISMSPIDSIKHYLKFLNTGMVALDPEGGAVRVWVGGINHQFFQYDHVRYSTRRQVGSTFKPIVYAAALEKGVRPCSFISAEKTTYTNMEGWTPRNTEENYDLRYSMQGGLVYSVNTVSVRVLEKVGIDKTIEVARSMGITSHLEPVPSLALGTAEISLLELAGAYSCFANKGKFTEPHFITSILSHENDVLEIYQPSGAHQAISEETAELMLHMLKRAVDEGTGSGLRSRFGLTNDVAGKTGTTQSNTDGWFMAITPNLVMGAWVGADDARIRFRSTALGQGAQTALPIIGDLMNRINHDEQLTFISNAKFPELKRSLANKIDCDLYKEDTNFLKKIFGKKDDKEKKKEFGTKEKKGFFKRLFEN